MSISQKRKYFKLYINLVTAIKQTDIFLTDKNNVYGFIEV